MKTDLPGSELFVAAADHGIALLCEFDGIVRHLVRDELALAGRVPPGASITALADPGSAEKARQFLGTVQTQHAAFDWEITVPLHGALVPLHWAGGATSDGLLIVAARTRHGLTRLNEELSRINNEQTNAVRAITKDLALAAARAAERDDALYDEVSRVNNELSNLQRELAKKNVELERLNAQKNQLLGMAAHDLRNPLGVIMTYAEFLAEEAADVLNEEQREFVANIKESSEFLLKMINDLLDISAIESGKLRLDLAPVSLAALLQRNIALNRVLAEKKQIHIELRLDADLPALPLDGGKIQQVLNNFLSNACKFSHPGTTVEVRLYQAGADAVISVRDQGQGIPAAELERLFKPFHKTSVRSTAGEQSTGLGLAIVRKIVAGHGGRVSVESEVGHGSTFSFTLPLSSHAI